MSKKGFILLIVVILAIPITKILSVLIAIYFKDSFETIAAYGNYIYFTILYLSLSALIFIEIKNLDKFNIDKFSLLTFMFIAFLRTRTGIAGENIFLLLIGAAGVAIIFIWVVYKPTVLKTNLRWAVLGVVLAVISIAPIFFLELFLRNSWSASPLIKNSINLTSIAYVTRELSFVTVVEELMFRSFLWGYLKEFGWAENKIFWSQGVMFWLIHFDRLFGAPFVFFLAVPMVTLIFSVLVLKSKQIFPSILSHTVINAVSAILNLGTF